MSGKFNMDDYVDVAERIVLFRDKHPEGSLQSSVLRYPEDGFPWVVVEARAYRTPDDERPGIGLAWEPFPGRTPFTKDSELMVCETSAWGRAIVAVGAADTKRGIASRNEIQARQEPQAQPPVSASQPRSASGRGSTPASSGTTEPQPEDVPRGSSSGSPSAVPSGEPPWFEEWVEKVGASEFCKVASKFSKGKAKITDPSVTANATEEQRQAIIDALTKDEWTAPEKANA